MEPAPPGLLDSLRSRRAVRRWRRAAAAARDMPVADLARLVPQARAVALHAGEIVRAAERRLGAARGAAAGHPPHCDWVWRPAPWAEALDPPVVAGPAGGHVLAPGVALFHDCPLRETTLRQLRATRPGAPFAIEIDAFGFDGGFLSMALDLPDAALGGFHPGQLVGLEVRLEQERPAGAYARLNLRHGPNTEQLVSDLHPPAQSSDPRRAEFDLGTLDFNPARLDKAWIDLILDRPGMNRIRIDDVVASRRPRAEL